MILIILLKLWPINVLNLYILHVIHVQIDKILFDGHADDIIDGDNSEDAIDNDDIILIRCAESVSQFRYVQVQV